MLDMRNGLRIGDRPALRLTTDEARQLARALKAQQTDPTPTTVLPAIGRPITLDPIDGGVAVQRGRTAVVISTVESTWIVKAFNG